MSEGFSPASTIAPAMARSAPMAEGMTMSWASADMAKPTTSAKISAPRAVAWSQSSKTKTPAPSPCTMPLRLAENGRQASRDMTRSPSHALTPPKQSIASDPPASITRAAPERTIWKARPMAWFEEAQAVATVKAGPRSPNSMLTWLAAALFISFGTTKG
nr:hypothetical protein [Paracoccus sanguinis]